MKNYIVTPKEPGRVSTIIQADRLKFDCGQTFAIFIRNEKEVVAVVNVAAVNMIELQQPAS